MRSEGQDSTPGVLSVPACLAFRLTAPDLVTPGYEPIAGPPDEPTRLRRLLERDPPGFSRVTAQDAVAQVADEAVEPLAGLERLARALVRIEGGKPCADTGPAWELVARIVDPDLLVAAALSGHLPWPEDDGDWPGLVAWPLFLRGGRNAFDAVLSRRMTETHLHLGGALPPSVFWLLALVQLTGPTSLLPLAVSDSPLAEPWQQALLDAADALASLYDCLYGCPAGRAAVPRVPECMGGPLPPYAPAACPRRCPSAPGDGLRLLDRLAGLAAFDPPVPEDASLLWPLGPGKTLGSVVLPGLAPERRLVWEALAAWRLGGFAHPASAALERYVLVKNAFHYTLIHHRGSRGLARFREKFARPYSFVSARGWERRTDRRWKANVGFERRRVAQVIETFLWDAVGELPGPLAAQLPPLDLELRVRMDPGRAFWDNLLAWGLGVRDVLRANPGLPLRVGLVYHFLRTPSDDGLSGSAEWLADGLFDVLADAPDLRPLIVGVDVAGDELAAPPRTHAPLYHHVRGLLDAQRPSAGPRRIRLGLTYHVGEDFRDLLTGLRHVDEAAHLLALLPGDRLGHALALAWMPRTFYERQVAVYPLGREHVLDLLWAWRLLEGQPDPARQYGARARDWLRAALARAGVLTPLDGMERAARLLDQDGPARPAAPDDAWSLRATGLEDEREPGAGPAGRRQTAPASEEDLLQVLGLDPDRWGDRVVSLPTPRADFVRLVAIAQRLVRARVLRRNLVIEVCPSSNLAIGGFRSYADLPYLRLSRHGLPTKGRPQPDLPLSLNTDDPGLFLTTLRNEYQKMGEALVERGYPQRMALAWLDEARLVGVDSTFIPPWAPRGRELLALLGRLLSASRSRSELR